jgi:tetratricopeptide (TPR) repeat protein
VIRPGAVAAALTALALSGLARTQPWLAQTAHAIRESKDVYAFPPPAQLHAATLGWDAAGADQLWAKLLVEYGTHWAEHRDFTEAPNYLDAILELEPGYEPLYRYVDTILAYRPLLGTEADARKAREYLERGTRERPQDSLLWLRYGEFVALLGPSFLHDEAEQTAWRRDGAVAIGRAVELGADADRVLSAASLLSRSGQTEAAIRSLERSYAFTEHPSMAAVHEAIGRKLEALHASQAIESARSAERVIDERWEHELPFLRRDTYLLLGPAVDTARCSGIDASRDPACRREWNVP